MENALGLILLPREIRGKREPGGCHLKKVPY
jgi:hypothetical protein